MRLPLHILSILLLLAFAERGSAQSEAIAIPAWMQPYFAEGSTTTLPAGDRGPVKNNSFIGSYTARMTIHDTLDGITQMLYLSAWQDSTRGIMQLELVRGHPHNTWFADIEANMGVVANAMGRKAVVSDLGRVLLVDRLRAPGQIRTVPNIPLTAVGRSTLLAGQLCTEHDLVERQDTMHVWTADIAPSPFADGPAWIPLNEGVLKTFRFLYKFGDLVVFKFVLEPLLELEVIEYHAGPTPPPVIMLQNYEVVPVTDLISPEGRP